MSIRDTIDAAPFSRYQVRVVVLCLILCMVDGYDLLVSAFAASGIAKEWGLSGSQVGLVLSSGLVGTGLGSAILAPLADRFGRRPLTVGCLAISTVGMALATFSTGLETLVAYRLITGLGVGGLVASLPVLIAEYSPRRRQGTAIALYTTGLPLGGVLGGMVAGLLISEYGWRSSFAVGAVISGLMLVVIAVALPESIDYLVTRRPPNALARINALLLRMGHTPLEELPAPGTEVARGVRSEVIRGRNGVKTTLLWASFFVLMASFYFAASWTPKLLEQSGASAEQGLSGGMLLNVGGVVATLGFGLLALTVSKRTLTAGSMVAMAVTFVGMSFALGNLTATLIVAVAVGIAMNAAAAGIYTIAPELYPAEVRTTAVGWAAAFGRLGAICSPVLAGVLIDRAWTPGSLFVLFAVPTVAAAAAVLAMTRLGKTTGTSPAGARRELASPLN
ncbi:MFS transporter [Streptomyces cinereospinus]|uniref:MFS transporter n=1 Tax=Streptomyces cinereospinus TaxID=285561 RepID=A0ABV5N3L8_9ACTN